MSNDDRYRESGVIDNVYESDNRGRRMFGLDVGFAGAGQGFGFLALSSADRDLYVRMLCEAFGVPQPRNLVGRPCVALRSFPYFNEPIEGLEDPESGRRFTITGFLRAAGLGAGSPLEVRLESTRREIERHEKRAAETRGQLTRLTADYRSWE